MDKGSDIDVSASRNGPGGSAVLWSEDYTGFHGNIRARGGPQSGDGGQVETSSQRNLQAFGQVDASAVRGSAGYWLLDPAEVTIVSSGAESGVMTKVGNIPAEFFLAPIFLFQRPILLRSSIVVLIPSLIVALMLR
ncbi:hypothetical protein AU253_01480 [Yersinia pestis]|nr:hypothetical protein AU253_01480 [Yersinia pestis]